MQEAELAHATLALHVDVGTRKCIGRIKRQQMAEKIQIHDCGAAKRNAIGTANF